MQHSIPKVTGFFIAVTASLALVLSGCGGDRGLERKYSGQAQDAAVFVESALNEMSPQEKEAVVGVVPSVLISMVAESVSGKPSTFEGKTAREIFRRFLFERLVPAQTKLEKLAADGPRQKVFELFTVSNLTVTHNPDPNFSSFDTRTLKATVMNTSLLTISRLGYVLHATIDDEEEPIFHVEGGFDFPEGLDTGKELVAATIFSSSRGAEQWNKLAVKRAKKIDYRISIEDFSDSRNNVVRFNPRFEQDVKEAEAEVASIKARIELLKG